MPITPIGKDRVNHCITHSNGCLSGNWATSCDFWDSFPQPPNQWPIVESFCSWRGSQPLASCLANHPWVHYDPLTAPWLSAGWVLQCGCSFTSCSYLASEGPCCQLALLLWDPHDAITIREPGSITSSAQSQPRRDGCPPPLLLRASPKRHPVPLFLVNGMSSGSSCRT